MGIPAVTAGISICVCCYPYNEFFKYLWMKIKLAIQVVPNLSGFAAQRKGGGKGMVLCKRQVCTHRYICEDLCTCASIRCSHKCSPLTEVEFHAQAQVPTARASGASHAIAHSPTACVAQFRTGYGLIVGCGLEVGDP